MPKVSGHIVVARPREAVFRLTQDYYLRKEWDPFVREIRFLGGATEPAVGVGVWVRAWHGLAMTVECVSYRFPDLAAIKMTKGPPSSRRSAACGGSPTPGGALRR